MTVNNRPLFIPALGAIYSKFDTLAETLLRVTAGALLVVHGAGKITDPFGSIEMVGSLGFHPGVFWSPLLAITGVFGGILLVLGLFTRPAAFATTIVLVVTIYFHWVTAGQGYFGAEKSILWTFVLLYFLVRGANAHSVDARIGREF